MSSPTDLFSAKGIVALITGGGTGLGLVMARALAEAGAERVYIAGRRLEVLRETAAAIEPKREGAAKDSKPVVVAVACDVTSKDSLADVEAQIQAEVGYLNVLVCNAGIIGPQTPFNPQFTLAEYRAQQLAMDTTAYNQTFAVNTTAVWFTAMTFLTLLDEGNKRKNIEQSSQVVVTASIAGFNKKSTGGYAYGQSKAGAVLAAKQLAVVLPQWGIRANAIAPGLFPSAMTETLLNRPEGFVPEQEVPLDKNLVPLGRMGDSKDMAGTILYAVSRAGAYLNGAVLLLDGGRLGTFPSSY